MRECKPNNGMRHQGVAPEKAVLSGVEEWFICCKGFMDKLFYVRNGQRKEFCIFVNRLLRRYRLTLVCHTPTCRNTAELQVCTLFSQSVRGFLSYCNLGRHSENILTHPNTLQPPQLFPSTFSPKNTTTHAHTEAIISFVSPTVFCCNLKWAVTWVW